MTNHPDAQFLQAFLPTDRMHTAPRQLTNEGRQWFEEAESRVIQTPAMYFFPPACQHAKAALTNRDLSPTIFTSAGAICSPCAVKIGHDDISDLDCEACDSSIRPIAGQRIVPISTILKRWPDTLEPYMVLVTNLCQACTDRFFEPADEEQE